MEWNDFVENVQRWSRERGIYEHSTALMQLYKSISEYGELVDGLAKKNKQEVKDGIGDVAVTLVNVAAMLNISLEREVDLLRLDCITNRLVYSLHASLGRLLDEVTKSDVCAAGVDAALHSSLYALRGVAHNEGLDFGECLQTAWDAIKHRKGKMVPGGVFVKEVGE